MWTVSGDGQQPDRAQITLEPGFIFPFPAGIGLQSIRGISNINHSRGRLPAPQPGRLIKEQVVDGQQPA